MSMRRTVDLVILVVVLLGGFFAIRNAVAIGDWWHARNYSPSDSIAQMSTDAGMSEKGEKLFYRFSPKLVSRQILDEECTVNKLGCAEGQSIHILQYDDEESYKQAVVTAAHEMLHVAYSRLSDQELDYIHSLIDEQMHLPSSQSIKTKLDGYPDEDYYTEAHSFIGSELEDVIPELEDYYGNYFSDRGKVVQAYKDSR